MPNSQDRIFGYDLIKTIAIIMIVFYHLGGIDYGVFETGHFYLPNLNKFFSGLCAAGVPLFFMVNGALVIHKKMQLKQLLFKAFHSLFLLVFWKFVLQYFISNWLLNIKENMVHFWFLGTLSIIYLISIILQKSTCLRYSVIAFLCFFPFLYNFIWDIYLFFSPSFNSFKIIHTGFFTLYSILYYFLGDHLRNHQISRYYSLFLTLLGLILVNFEVVAMSNHFLAVYDGVNSSFPTFGALFMSVGIFLFFKDVSLNDGFTKKIISFVGQNTLGIFIFHVLIILILHKFIPCLFFHNNLIVSLSISLLITLFASFISMIINHSFFSFLVSLSSRF